MRADSNETSKKITQEQQKQARLKNNLYFSKRQDQYQKQLL